MNRIAKAPGPNTYARINEGWHRLDTSMGTYYGYTREEVMAKHDTDLLNAFEKHGAAASFLLGSGRPAAASSAEKRIALALELYHEHPHLQDKMHIIALGFKGWNLMMRLESEAIIEQNTLQRGVLA